MLFHTHIVSGVIFSVIASILWAISPLLVDRVRASSYVITLIRNLATLVVSSLYILLSDPREAVVGQDLVFMLLLLGVVGPGLADQLYIASIKRIGVSLSTALSYTYVFWTTYIASLLSLDIVSLYDVVGTIVSFTGLLLGLWTRDKRQRSVRLGVCYLVGIVMAVFSGLMWGLATVLSRIVVVQTSIPVIVFYRTLSATLLMTIFLSIERGFHRYRGERIGLREVVTTAVSGILSFLIAYYLFLASMLYIGVVMSSLITLFSPLATLLFSAVYRREEVDLGVVVGTLVIVGGLLVASMKYFF